MPMARKNKSKTKQQPMKTMHKRNPTGRRRGPWKLPSLQQPAAEDDDDDKNSDLFAEESPKDYITDDFV